MSISGTVLLIAAGVVLLGGFLTGLVFFILFLARTLGGTTGGWRQLTAVYGTASPPAGQITHGETVQIGPVVYKRCVALGVAGEGLYVSIWRKTALIPWSEFKGLGETTLYWQKLPLLTVGDPPRATMTLPIKVFQSVQGKLPAEFSQKSPAN